jgi:hypothetical protein
MTKMSAAAEARPDPVTTVTMLVQPLRSGLRGLPEDEPQQRSQALTPAPDPFANELLQSNGRAGGTVDV